MPLSLKSRIKKFKYKGQITNAEYEDVLEKLVGHDKHLRNDVIDEFAEKLSIYSVYDYCGNPIDIQEIADQLREY